MSNIFERAILGPIKIFFERLVDFLPVLLSAIFVFIAGILLAVFARYVTLRVLHLTGLDSFSERSGIMTGLKKAGVREPLSFIISQIVLWFIIIGFSIFALWTLNIPALERMFERFVLYLPNVFAAFVIIVFGYLLSNFLARAALIAAVNAGIKVAGMIARLVKAGLIILTITMALEQLGIGKGAITVAFAIIFGGIVLALALAFGLGGKDIARQYLEEKVKGVSEKDRIEHL